MHALGGARTAPAGARDQHGGPVRAPVMPQAVARIRPGSDRSAVGRVWDHRTTPHGPVLRTASVRAPAGTAAPNILTGVPSSPRAAVRASSARVCPSPGAQASRTGRSWAARRRPGRPGRATGGAGRRRGARTAGARPRRSARPPRRHLRPPAADGAQGGRHHVLPGGDEAVVGDGGEEAVEQGRVEPYGGPAQPPCDPRRVRAARPALPVAPAVLVGPWRAARRRGRRGRARRPAAAVRARAGHRGGPGARPLLGRVLCTGRPGGLGRRDAPRGEPAHALQYGHVGGGPAPVLPPSRAAGPRP